MVDVVHQAAAAYLGVNARIGGDGEEVLRREIDTQSLHLGFDRIFPRQGVADGKVLQFEVVASLHEIARDGGVVAVGSTIPYDRAAFVEIAYTRVARKRPIKSSHLCNEFVPICAAHPLSNFASSYSG